MEESTAVRTETVKV